MSEVDDCFYQASKANKVRARDSYVNINKYDLAKEIAQRYDKQMRPGKIVYGNNHFYVVNEKKIEIFNSVSPGYGHQNNYFN